MSPPFEPEGCALVRRNPWVLGLSQVLLQGSAAWVLGGKLTVLRTPAWQVALRAAWWIPAIMFLGYILASWRPWVKPLHVRADARGLTIGERFVPRAAIRRGVVLPGEPAQVKLDLRGLRLPVQLRMGNAGDASALLQVLGLDEAHTVAEFRAASRLGNAGFTVVLLAQLLLIAGCSRAHARIRAAMDQFRERESGAGGSYRESTDQGRTAPFLQRGARSLAEWAAALRALGAGGREAPRARLFRIVEDPAAEAADRVAAAVALGGDLRRRDRRDLRPWRTG